MLSTTSGKKVDVQVFVTTQEAVEENYAAGKWFSLSKYQNKEAFIAAASKYVAANIRGLDHVLYFANKRADFEVFEAFINTDDVSRQIWEALKMSDSELKLVDGWYSFYGVADGGVADTLAVAKRTFEGYFEDEEAYAAAYLKKYGASDALIDSLKEHSRANQDDNLSVVAAKYNANDDVINLLCDHTSLQKAGEWFVEGSFCHKGLYFEM